ncbi:MAG: KEOPS complex kinase/ATPase Bud32 [Candidatus Aenigmatarchaeota archaeon]
MQTLFMSEKEIIARGAEAVLYKDRWQGMESLTKKRLKKGYRIEDLDKKLRKERTRKEAKLLSDSRRGRVSTPQVYEVDEEMGILKMEFVEGEKVRNILKSLSKEKLEEIFEKIGQNIGRLHNNRIIHGDLTTSNMLFKDGKIYFIDFGLGFTSESIEDRAVDLYLLYEVLKSSHSDKFELLWNSVLNGYKERLPDSDNVMKRFEKLKKRRRYVG